MHLSGGWKLALHVAVSAQGLRVEMKCFGFVDNG